MPNPDETDRTHRHRTTDPDASADWRTEYAAQHVDAQLRADGGAVTLPEVGDKVRDRDTGDELLVVKVRADTRADEHAIAALEGATVADVNESYDPAAPVVDVVYVEEVAEKLDGWRTVEDLRDAVAFDALRCYSFPADRLGALQGGERR